MFLWSRGDGWLPPKRVWVAALVMTFVVTPICILLGKVGAVLFGIVVIVCLAVGARARSQSLGAEEFWRSRPKD